ncbi:MAG: hypothetical protein LBJ10_02675 [Clostridiales bacterium]|jgi:hypothetical protein|nr:hypothetical protein [Clostridiales bacterium]
MRLVAVSDGARAYQARRITRAELGGIMRRRGSVRARRLLALIISERVGLGQFAGQAIRLARLTKSIEEAME